MKTVGQFLVSSKCAKAFDEIFDFIEIQGDVLRYEPTGLLSLVLAIQKMLIC